MATMEQQRAGADSNGSAPETIVVENPATGETIREVPKLDASAVAELVERSRTAQPIWNSLGFDGRAALMRDLRSWIVENRARVVDTIVSESGKTREDAQLAELVYAADALGFWAKKAPKYLKDQH